MDMAILLWILHHGRLIKPFSSVSLPVNVETLGHASDETLYIPDGDATRLAVCVARGCTGSPEAAAASWV